MGQLGCDTPQAEAEWQWFCWHWKNRHCARSVSMREAMEVFREELPGICLDKMASGEDAKAFSGILEGLRRKAEGKETMADRIARAKAYPILRLAEELSGEPVRMGKIRHPGERTASIHIYEKDNRWFDFGRNTGGDTIDLMALYSGCKFAEAVERLS